MPLGDASATRCLSSSFSLVGCTSVNDDTSPQCVFDSFPWPARKRTAKRTAGALWAVRPSTTTRRQNARSIPLAGAGSSREQASWEINFTFFVSHQTFERLRDRRSENGWIRDACRTAELSSGGPAVPVQTENLISHINLRSPRTFSRHELSSSR